MAATKIKLNQLIQDGATTTNQAIVWNSSSSVWQPSTAVVALNGGNSLGAAMMLGTNDSNSLQLETNGVVKLTINTTGQITTAQTSSNTNTQVNALTLSTDGGTVTAGFGNRILFQAETATVSNRDSGFIGPLWTNSSATDASRTSAMILGAVNNAGTVGEVGRFQAASTPYLTIASAVGTAGTTQYRNDGIIPGTSFVIGGNTQTINIGNYSGTGGDITIGGGGYGGSVELSNSSLFGVSIGASSNNGSALGVVIGSGNLTYTTGGRKVLVIGGGYAAASGSATFTTTELNSTINQTGSSSGITRGFYDNSTLTSVVDYRSVEIAVNHANSKGVWQTGSNASNYFAGKVSLGTSTISDTLRVNGSVRLDLGSDTTGDIFYRNSGGTLSRLAVGSNGNSLILTAGLPTWAQVDLTAGVTGTLPVANGGTGGSSWTVGALLTGGSGSSLVQVTDVATGNALLSGGLGTAPFYGKVGLATHVSGNLPVTNLNSGTSASSSTFWRGDGTWATPSGGSSIYTGSGTIPTSVNATITDIFKIIFPGPSDGLKLDYTNGIAGLYDPTATSLVSLDSGSATIGSGSNSIYIDSGGSLVSGQFTVGNAGFETSGGIELDSTTKAVIVSRMTTTQKNALTAVNGMVLYDATLDKFQFREGGAWTTISGGGSYTFSTGLTNSSGTITNNLSTGISGGQSVIGGTAASNNLTLSSTTNGTKGSIIFGTSAYDEVNNRLGIKTTSPSLELDVRTTTATTNALQTPVQFTNSLTTGTVAAGFGTGVLFQGTANNGGSPSVLRDMGSMGFVWQIATDGSRTSDAVFNAVNSATGPSEVARFTAGGPPTLLIASSMGTKGTTQYKDNSISNGGVAFTLGGSSQTVTVSSVSTSSTALLLNASDNASSVTFGNTAYTSGILAKTAFVFSDSYTASSGSGTYTALKIANTINMTSTASGAQIGLDVNPTLTSLTAATYRGINIPYSNTAAFGIYQSGTSTKNIFAGKNTFGTTTAGSEVMNITGNMVVTGQYVSKRFALTDGATIALDWNNGNDQSVTIAGNRTFTFANPIDGGRYLIKIKQDATGSRTITWPTITWKGGTAPTLTTTANKTDFIYLYYDGTSYFGSSDLNF